MPSATPLKPIVGAFRRRVIRDVSIGLIGGAIASEVYWKICCSHVEKTEKFYANLDKKYLE